MKSPKQLLKRSGVKISLLIGAVILCSMQARLFAQGEYKTDHGHVSFYSKAPVADVDAKNDHAKVELNPATQEISFSVDMPEFEFENRKMGRDAEDKYIETARYSHASFKGRIVGKVDYDKPGSYPVTAKGKMKIHGVEKSVAEKGKITVLKNRQLHLESEFSVALKDYNIDTPSILGKEMTQDAVSVKVEATLAKPIDTAKK